MSTAYVDVVSMGKGLVTVGGRGGAILLGHPVDRDPKRPYSVEDDSGQRVGAVRFYADGARLLAKLYGVEVSSVEVDHEWMRRFREVRG